MRIAQVSPLFESVPPKLYGGTERVVSWLTEELVNAGHQVTLFASGDSETSAELVPMSPRALWREGRRVDPVPQHLRMVDRVFRERARFDVIHFHTDWLHYPFLQHMPVPSVTTLHGRLDLPECWPAFEAYPHVPLVSISDDQRRPVRHARWLGTVHHGLPPGLHQPSYEPGKHLLFLGRICPEKRVDRAVAIALATGMPLKIAARIAPEDLTYFERVITPILASAGERVEFLGEVGGEVKDKLLRDASALLFPIDWPEPFGLVMIEAMACGTPVIAWRSGSVPEVVQHGTTGFVVEDLDQAVAAVHRLGEIDRRVVRTEFERRFTAARMARDYLDLYDRVRRPAAKRPLISSAPVVASRSSNRVDGPSRRHTWARDDEETPLPDRAPVVHDRGRGRG